MWPPMKRQVYGVGNALLDYQVHVSNEFLEKHGFKKGSMTLVDADLQHKIIKEIRSTLGAHTIKQTSGGCAANTLAGLANFGGNAAFVGKIANDEHGIYYRKDLQDIGVKFDTEAGHSDHTGTCLALITPDAERTMLTHLGIATHLSKRDVDAKQIAASEIVYIEGYLWDPAGGREASEEAIAIAKQQKKKIAFTFSDSFCVTRHHQDFVNLAKNSVDILFCNESEALSATKTTQVQDAFRIMKDWSDTVCITIGAKGALLSSRSMKALEEIPTWDVKLVDKLGAGDLFASGVLYGLTHDKSLRESGFLGCYSATRIIEQMSARLAVSLKPHIEEACQGPSLEQRPIAV